MLRIGIGVRKTQGIDLFAELFLRVAEQQLALITRIRFAAVRIDEACRFPADRQFTDQDQDLLSVSETLFEEIKDMGKGILQDCRFCFGFLGLLFQEGEHRFPGVTVSADKLCQCFIQFFFRQLCFSMR